MVSEPEINQKPLTASDLEKIRKALCEAANALRSKKLNHTQVLLQRIWCLTEDWSKRMNQK